MKRILLMALMALSLAAAASAQEVFPRHEIRVGWGDMGFEKAAFHNSLQKVDYQHIGHFFAGYRYSFLKWLGAGMDVDYSRVNWRTVEDDARHNYRNISLIPSVRFTYFRKKIVTMYSGIGVGVNINTGSDLDYAGRQTMAVAVFNPTWFGISLNCKNWFGTFEFSPLISMKNSNQIFMINARMFSLSIGYRL